MRYKYTSLYYHKGKEMDLKMYYLFATRTLLSDWESRLLYLEFRAEPDFDLPQCLHRRRQVRSFEDFV